MDALVTAFCSEGGCHLLFTIYYFKVFESCTRQYEHPVMGEMVIFDTMKAKMLHRIAGSGKNNYLCATSKRGIVTNRTL